LNPAQKMSAINMVDNHGNSALMAATLGGKRFKKY
jgi:hypothetical protein